MKDLLTCSLDELLTERQLAVESDNIPRYRECNELISTLCANKAAELDIKEMYDELNTI